MKSIKESKDKLAATSGKLQKTVRKLAVITG